MQETEKDYLNLLYDKYQRLTITKKELAHELGISERTLNARIAQNRGIPRYLKGRGRNAKVTFPIADVAKYLSNSIIINEICPW